LIDYWEVENFFLYARFQRKRNFDCIRTAFCTWARLVCHLVCQVIQEKKNNIKEKQKIISFIVFLQRLFFVIIFCRTLNMKIFFSVQYITWDKEYLFEKKSLQEIGQRIISHTGYHSKRFNNISIDNYCSRSFLTMCWSLQSLLHTSNSDNNFLLHFFSFSNSFLHLSSSTCWSWNAWDHLIFAGSNSVCKSTTYLRCKAHNFTIFRRAINTVTMTVQNDSVYGHFTQFTAFLISNFSSVLPNETAYYMFYNQQTISRKCKDNSSRISCSVI